MLKVPPTLLEPGGDLASIAPEKADKALAFLSPIHALHIYVLKKLCAALFLLWRLEERRAVSKLRLAYWIVDTIAYHSQGMLCETPNVI